MKNQRQTARLRVENAMQHFKAFIACHGAGRHAQELKVVEYVRFDTGKAGFRRAQTVGFNGKGDILRLDKPVVALCKLVFSISRYSVRIELKASSCAGILTAFSARRAASPD